MPEPISKVQRWLDLIAYLIGRRFPVPVEELMERLPAYARDWLQGDETARATVRRKFERDKDELRTVGIPLETVTYTINYGAEEVKGYRIAQSDFYLPYLKLLQKELFPGAPGLAARRRSWLDRFRPGPHRADLPPGETDAPRPADTGGVLGDVPGDEQPDLFSLAPDGSIEIPRDVAADVSWGLQEIADLPGFPMAPAARGALRKLTFDMDPQKILATGASPPDFTRRDVVFAIPPETAGAQEHLDALSDALFRRKTVTFRYHGIERDRVTDREVRPYGLLFKHSHWYLVGWDEDRAAQRVFRVDRMEGVRVNPSAPATADYEMPAERVLEAYRDREAWELGEADEAVQALVRFRFPTSLWAARNGYGSQVAQQEDGSTLRRFEVRQPDPFLRWILSLEGEAVIESPPALLDAFRALARRVADLHRGDPNA